MDIADRVALRRAARKLLTGEWQWRTNNYGHIVPGEEEGQQVDVCLLGAVIRASLELGMVKEDGDPFGIESRAFPFAESNAVDFNDHYAESPEDVARAILMTASS